MNATRLLMMMMTTMTTTTMTMMLLLLINDLLHDDEEEEEEEEEEKEDARLPHPMHHMLAPQGDWKELTVKNKLMAKLAALLSIAWENKNLPFGRINQLRIKASPNTEARQTKTACVNFPTVTL